MAPIPKTQKAIVINEPRGELLYKEIPVPTPENDELLVHIQYSGACHSDLHAWKADWPFQTPFPLIGGHEGAGVVVAKGDAVRNFNIGDRVGIKWVNSTCLDCRFCLQGADGNCPKATYSGFTHDGTFQQYGTVKAAHAARIPDGVDLAMVAPILCAGITVYKALKRSDAKPGDNVVITGAGGGLGSLAVQYAKAMGFRVIGIDSGEAKKKLVLSTGGEAFIDFKTDDIVKGVLAATDGEGAQAVVHVAVSEKAVETSLEYIRPTGTIVLVGLPADAVVHSPVFSHVLRTITIRGSLVGNREDTVEALDFVRRGLVSTPIKIVGMSEIAHVYDLMEKGQIAGRYVLDTSK
ncbi:uncharacterized protein SAPINGB_P000446 [Magnusiomyces paraingens]|uniref:alcohol dehydrogenase n=1 Tax=Magnusiomyces paraingens TaxID=2606893 RepID=A0A5E8AZT0_9ASCO|nr:uncharacterized protein SAPINGB_P000446 [Saprochaete ingens]VVT44527.1 unnamed protein product [Saprochaete ingens]